jgi:hypothetical protein
MKNEKRKESLQQSISEKCGDKDAPVATYVANAFLPLDTVATYRKCKISKSNLDETRVLYN